VIREKVKQGVHQRQKRRGSKDGEHGRGGERDGRKGLWERVSGDIEKVKLTEGENE